MSKKTNPEIVTIGVYGFDEEGFFAALQRAKVDVFCDIRRRRGVRGSMYAFANSQRLQAKLAALGIRYLHWFPLAPSTQTRHLQDDLDQAAKTTKRQRTQLGSLFVQTYQDECLAHFDDDLRLLRIIFRLQQKVKKSARAS